MPKIKIGSEEHELRPETATMGFRRHTYIPWREKLTKAEGEAQAIDLMVEGVSLFVPLSVEQLFDVLPNDEAAIAAIIGDCLVACGMRKSAAPEGEAKAQ